MLEIGALKTFPHHNPYTEHVEECNLTNSRKERQFRQKIHLNFSFFENLRTKILFFQQ